MPDVLSVGLGGGSHVEQSQVSILLTHVTFIGVLIIVLRNINLMITSKYFHLLFCLLKKKMNE